jgi:hypothetical protein
MHRDLSSRRIDVGEPPRNIATTLYRDSIIAENGANAQHFSWCGVVAATLV